MPRRRMMCYAALPIRIIDDGMPAEEGAHFHELQLLRRAEIENGQYLGIHRFFLKVSERGPSLFLLR